MDPRAASGLVTEYEASDLTQAKFARRAGSDATTSAHWVQLSRGEAKAKTMVSVAASVAMPLRFVEVQATAQVAAASEISLPRRCILSQLINGRSPKCLLRRLNP